MTAQQQQKETIGDRTVTALMSLMFDIHKNAIDKGFYDTENLKTPLESLCLMHAEVSELMEADYHHLRSEKLEGVTGVAEEAADILMRILDFSAYHHYDVPNVLMAIVEDTFPMPDDEAEIDPDITSGELVENLFLLLGLKYQQYKHMQDHSIIGLAMKINIMLSKAVECFRKSNTTENYGEGYLSGFKKVEIYLAKAVYALVFLCHEHGIELYKVTLAKHEYNKGRERLHGKTC